MRTAPENIKSYFRVSREKKEEGKEEPKKRRVNDDSCGVASESSGKRRKVIKKKAEERKNSNLKISEFFQKDLTKQCVFGSSSGEGNEEFLQKNPVNLLSTSPFRNLPHDEWMESRAKDILEEKTLPKPYVTPDAIHRHDSLARARKILSRALSEQSENIESSNSSCRTPAINVRRQNPLTPEKVIPLRRYEGSRLSVSRKLFDTTTKPSLKSQVAAHERFKSLTEKADSPTPNISIPSALLPLPDHYNLLLQQFKVADSILYLRKQRGEACNFLKLQQSVEEVTKRNFDLDDLARFNNVYPGSFALYIEDSGRNRIMNTSNKLSNLMIQSIFESDSENDQKTLTIVSRISSSQLTQRYETFQFNLFKIVHQHHINLLKSLSIDIEFLYNGDQIKRWHPKFILYEVPHVNPDRSFLPQAVLSPIKPVTAKDLLIQNAGIVLNDKVRSVLEDLAQNNSVTVPKFTPSQFKTMGLLKTVEPALLARIREKEKINNVKKMLVDRNSEMKLEMLERLPAIARTLIGVFRVEKVKCLPLLMCIKKIKEGCDNFTLSQNSIKQHLELMSSVVPNWLSVVSISTMNANKDDDSRKYVKVAEKNINDIVSIISQYQDQLKHDIPCIPTH